MSVESTKHIHLSIHAFEYAHDTSKCHDCNKMINQSTDSRLTYSDAFRTYHWVCKRSNMMGATFCEGTAYPFGAHWLTPDGF
jgi:hypothetical protein